MERWRRGFERLLERIVIVEIAALSLLVLVGVAFRSAGAALSWYDEVASILMAWLTYYGAALAAVKRAHIGFPGFVRSLPPARRKPVIVVAELLVFAFFVLLAWVGWQVFEILEGDRLVSLPSIPMQWAQSVIPVGSVLFIVAQALSLPATWRAASLTGEPPGTAEHSLDPHALTASTE
jgi:TRAP-type C4-dicarboxylate transport system permease small subunit